MLRNIQGVLDPTVGPSTAQDLAYPFSHQIKAELILTDAKVNEALEMEGLDQATCPDA